MDERIYPHASHVTAYLGGVLRSRKRHTLLYVCAGRGQISKKH